jgi:multicomponent Na+:H+ antiporter subunit F
MDDPIMHGFFIGAGIAMFLLMLPALMRVAVGPTVIDRIVAANVIGTKTAVLLIIIGTVYGNVGMFVDFALAYALLNFIGSLAASRYCHQMSVDDEQSATPRAKRTRRA